jgi:DNA-binding FadR family transcriptional regulator
MRKRSDAIAGEIKKWIVEKNLQSGHRLPQEKELTEHFISAKSTVREAIKVLEAQGLVTTKTGPGGGAFVTEMPQEKAISLLSNFFYFNTLTIKDIYQIRIQLEPEMAASLCGRLTPDDLECLKKTITIYSSPVATQEEEYQQRLNELMFHECLADLCPNPLLSFVCKFMLHLLKNLDFCHKIYQKPNQELFDTGRYYQMALYDALEQEDHKRVRQLMREHMLAAEKIMVTRERELNGRLE